MITGPGYAAQGHGRAAASVLLCMAAGGCTAGDHAPRVLVADSAGVPVYALQALQPWDAAAFMWDLQLERSIPTGSSDALTEPLLYQPQSYARLDDGSLIVLDGADLRVAVIPPDSNVVARRFGPSGQGPGEILSANSTIWPAGEGSFWLMDPGNHRLSRFGIDGRLHEERRIDIPGVAGVVFQDPVRHLPWFWKIFYEGPDHRFLTDSIGRLDELGGRVTYVAPMPPRVEARRLSGVSAPLFTPMGWFAPLGTGTIATGRNDTGRFRHHASDGTLLGIIDVPMRRASITEGQKDEAVREFAEVARGSGTAMTARDVGAEYLLYDLMWALEDSLFAIQQSHTSTPRGEPAIPEGQVVWRIFTPRGGYEGALILPHGVAQPYWIGPQRLIATHRDPFGVATINVYRLTRPALPSGYEN